MKNLILYTCLMAGCCSTTIHAENQSWPFLDIHTIGASSFLKQYPTYDGRGVVIIICDTGVDMGILGLQQTTTGESKVIEAHDFSGQGDIFLEEASLDTIGGEAALKIDGYHLTGFRKLEYQPEDSVYWMGVIDENDMFRNSNVRDINHNGKFNDLFGLITFPVNIENETRWIIYLDEDGDGNIQDERPIFDYKYKKDTFDLKGRDPGYQNAYMTFAIEILEDEMMASLHVSDGDHGSHCAGIASGYQIFGNSEHHGIAPGAQIISAKIGDNQLSEGCTTTGSMKKAFDFGVKWSRDHNIPVVFSLSYGIGSEIEGRSDIEAYLNNLMEENDQIVVVTSSGNEGPGISSVGNPACASGILSVGAMLPQTIARDVYGYTNKKDVIFHFSSRGGETNKPDCLAPGAAISTVPGYSMSERMWGTSMACPQVAGAAAVLMSACLQENIPFTGTLIKRAIRNSCNPMLGYTHLDQGCGIVDIGRAFEILKAYAQKNEKKWLIDYKIQTNSPIFQDHQGETAYWRSGGYFPSDTEKQQFTVQPIFPKNLSPDEKTNFYRTYRLTADQPWIKVNKKNSYIKGSHAMTFEVQYDPSYLKEPGLYVGTVTAYPNSGPGQAIPEFECIQTIIVPHVVSAENHYELHLKNKLLSSGEYHRYFVLVPPGATAMHLTLEASPNEWSGTYAYLFDPEGKERARLSKIDDETQIPISYSVLSDDLMPGIWEIIPYAYHNLPKQSHYDLTVEFEGLTVTPNPITNYQFVNGENPKGTFSVMNAFESFEGRVQGILNGYQKKQTLHVESDSYYYPFKIDEHISHVQFDVNVSKDTWNSFTDVAVNILDADDLVVKSNSMSYRDLTIDFWSSQSGDYALEIVAGFTYPGKQYDLWDVHLRETYFVTQPVALQVTQNGDSLIKLYPQLSSNLNFQFGDIPKIIPDGHISVGMLNFYSLKKELAGTVKLEFSR